MKKSVLQFMQAANLFAPFRWANRRRALVLTYHRFSEREHPARVSREQFAAQLKFLTRNYNILPLGEIIERLRGGADLPKNCVALTIDDGYRDAYEIAFPVLREFNVPATVFVVTDFLDRKTWLWTDKTRFLAAHTKLDRIEADFGIKKFDFPVDDKTPATLNDWLKTLPDDEKQWWLFDLQKIFRVKLPELPTAEFAPVTWAAAREMDAGGAAIESHTVAHPILTNVSDERLRFELENSKERLSDVLGRDANLFCYPNGAYDERVKKAVERAGYKSAVTTKVGFNEAKTDLFAVNRTDAPSDFVYFVQNASGFEHAKNRFRNAFEL